jgi:hypothetical protein
LVFDGWVQRGDASLLFNTNESIMGLYFGDYLARNTIVRNSDLQGLRYGIFAPRKAGDTGDIYKTQVGTLLIENTTLRNVHNIAVRTVYGVTGGLARLPPRRTIIRNVTFQAVAGNVGGTVQRDVAMTHELGSNANLIVRDEVFVLNHNNVSGANFQVFYAEQAPTFVLPISTPAMLAAPVAGLTNQQAWTQYGIAYAGQVAPCLTTSPNVAGFVCVTDALGDPFANTSGAAPPAMPLPTEPIAPTETPPPASVPVDCRVSDWGEWSAWGAWALVPDSSPKVEQRTRTRTRTVLEDAANGGAACPALIETEIDSRPFAPTVLPVTVTVEIDGHPITYHGTVTRVD